MVATFAEENWLQLRSFVEGWKVNKMISRLTFGYCELSPRSIISDNKDRGIQDLEWREQVEMSDVKDVSGAPTARPILRGRI